MALKHEHASIVRSQKGKSLLEFPEPYVVLNIQTTGYDPIWDEIIEFAGIRYVDGHPNSEFSTLIKPANEMDEYTTKITGITNEMVSGAPSLAEALHEIDSFIGNNIIIAHNANYDVNFLYDAYIKYLGKPLTNDYVDTMRLSRRLYPDLPRHRRCDLIEKFGIGSATADRSLGDAQQTEACYERMRSDFRAGIVQFSTANSRHQASYRKISSKDILPQATEFDIDSPIYGKTFCFTGTLEFAKRADAMQEVVDRGGFCADAIKKAVDYLVIGGDGYHCQLKSGKSSKWEKALKLKLSGSPIEVISEATFLDMLYS